MSCGTCGAPGGTWLEKEPCQRCLKMKLDNADLFRYIHDCIAVAVEKSRIRHQETHIHDRSHNQKR